nr:hypothetical protein GCM10025730_17680 [Promicromonospora thailandica]
MLTLGVLPMSTILYSIPASLPFVPEAWREAALNRIGGVEPEEVDPDDPLARLITEGSRHFASSSLPNPVPLTDDELRGLDMPVYVGLASDGSLSGGDAAERATLIPDARVKVWPDTTHSLPMQAADALGADLKQFWTTNDPSPR